MQQGSVRRGDGQERVAAATVLVHQVAVEFHILGRRAALGDSAVQRGCSETFERLLAFRLLIDVLFNFTTPTTPRCGEVQID